MEKSEKPLYAIQVQNGFEAPLVSIIFSYTKSEVSDGHETVELLQTTENISWSIAAYYDDTTNYYVGCSERNALHSCDRLGLVHTLLCSEIGAPFFPKGRPFQICNRVK